MKRINVPEQVPGHLMLRSIRRRVGEGRYDIQIRNVAASEANMHS